MNTSPERPLDAHSVTPRTNSVALAVYMAVWHMAQGTHDIRGKALMSDSPPPPYVVRP